MKYYISILGQEQEYTGSELDALYTAMQDKVRNQESNQDEVIAFDAKIRELFGADARFIGAIE